MPWRQPLTALPLDQPVPPGPYGQGEILARNTANSPQVEIVETPEKVLAHRKESPYRRAHRRRGAFMCSAADCFLTGLQRGSRSLTSYANEGICGRFGFVSTDGLLGYRLTRGFGLDDVGSQLHVSGV